MQQTLNLRYMGSTPLTGTILPGEWRNWQSRQLQVLHVGGSNPSSPTNKERTDMNNFEYVARRRRGYCEKFSDSVAEIFRERNKTIPFGGSVVDWLSQEADTALDFPVGSLVQWDESTSDCSNPDIRRNNIYGIVTKIEESNGILRAVCVKTYDRFKKPFEKYLFVEGSNNLRKSDIPEDIIELVRSSLLSGNIIDREKDAGK